LIGMGGSCYLAALVVCWKIEFVLRSCSFFAEGFRNANEKSDGRRA
jgi:hypothetical protein